MTEQNINKASLYHFLISLKISCISSFFFLLYWAFMAFRGRSLVEGRGGCSPLQCSRASLSCRAPALAARASGVHAGAHRLGPSGTRAVSGRGTRAQPLCCMWHPLGPGIEPVSPALAGRPPSTVPQWIKGSPRFIF